VPACCAADKGELPIQAALADRLPCHARVQSLAKKSAVSQEFPRLICRRSKVVVDGVRVNYGDSL
jgi:hypothetical protein